jgi:aspartate-semialdehyde dehydrogenase
MKDLRIAIAGATGLVGAEMLSVLNGMAWPVKEVRLLASEGSKGELYQARDTEVEVDTLGPDSFKDINIALFATSAELSKTYVPIAVKAGAIVVDNSSHFRMDPKVPLVVPEVNYSSIKESHKIIANPNCSTIQLVPVLAKIHELAGLKRIVVTTFQSVSGAGKSALDELWSQTMGVFNQKEIDPDVFAHPIAFNCIPQIDVLQENGYTKEESKIIEECRKILNLPNLKITATAVRVPVMFSHAESVNVETVKPLAPEILLAALEKESWAKVYPHLGEYPLQRNVAGTDEIHVGRVRRDESVENGLNFWVVADNVRKGAALNALQIVERLVATQ